MPSPPPVHAAPFLPESICQPRGVTPVSDCQSAVIGVNRPDPCPSTLKLIQQLKAKIEAAKLILQSAINSRRLFTSKIIENILENMSMGKTYHIRKVEGGGVSTGALKKKKRVLVSFPHSATPLLTA